MSFINVRAVGQYEEYEVLLNPEFANFIVPSEDHQLGNSIIHMALTGEAKSIYPVSLPLDALDTQFSGMRTAQIYNTAMGKVTCLALVNFRRVKAIQPDSRGFVEILFVDGDKLTVKNLPQV